MHMPEIVDLKEKRRVSGVLYDTSREFFLSGAANVALHGGTGRGGARIVWRCLLTVGCHRRYSPLLPCPRTIWARRSDPGSVAGGRSTAYATHMTPRMR